MFLIQDIMGNFLYSTYSPNYGNFQVSHSGSFQNPKILGPSQIPEGLGPFQIPELLGHS